MFSTLLKSQSQALSGIYHDRIMLSTFHFFLFIKLGMTMFNSCLLSTLYQESVNQVFLYLYTISSAFRDFIKPTFHSSTQLNTPIPTSTISLNGQQPSNPNPQLRHRTNLRHARPMRILRLPVQ